MKLARDKKGASLIFVLAAMMLLMAIGLSALTAAGMNRSAANEQRERLRNELYASSMERTVKSALGQTAGNEKIAISSSLTENRSLTRRMLSDAYQNEKAGLYNINMTLETWSPDGERFFSIKILGNLNVWISDYEIITIYVDVEVTDPDDPDVSIIISVPEVLGRTEVTAIINDIQGSIVVTQEMRKDNAEDSPLLSVTRTTYKYSGGFIREASSNQKPNGYYNESSAPSADEMLIANSGTWEVIRHETVFFSNQSEAQSGTE